MTPFGVTVLSVTLNATDGIVPSVNNRLSPPNVTGIITSRNPSIKSCLRYSKLVGYGPNAVACPALLAQPSEKALHICDLEFGKSLNAGVLEELPEALSNGFDCGGRKTALYLQIAAKRVDLRLMRFRGTI